MKRITAAAALGLLVTACRVGPDYTPPEIELPDRWQNAAVAGIHDGDADLRTWWSVFEDPTLDRLIDRAAQDNLGLQAAFWRVMRARALRGIVAADRVPTVDAFGDAERRRTSKETAGQFGGTRNTFALGAGMLWELDFFHRIRRNVAAAEADIEAAIEDYRDALVLLYAEIALTYVDLRTAQERIRFVESNIGNQRDTLQLTNDLFDAQIVPELDIRQAELNLARTEASLPALRQAQAAAAHRMAVLLGDHPSAVQGLIANPGDVPPAPQALNAHLPASLVRQRPDIRAAERALAAQVERIGVATADLYPRFTLDGSLSVQSNSTGSLFSSDAVGWSIGIPFQWNLFDRDRIHSNIAAQEAIAEELQLAYEQTVLLALEEVENSLVGYGEQGQRRAALERSVAAAEASVELVRTQYQAGLTNFQNVLDTERSLFQQQDQLARSRGDQVRQLIALYRALGGGWDPDAAEADANQPQP